jgi:predicted ABC-type ATPase
LTVSQKLKEEILIMIIWINGAFGSGKTTLAETLLLKLSNAMIYDPEIVGTMVRQLVPPATSSDFQDLPIWRDVVSFCALRLCERYHRSLLVPMTLVNPDYINEIFSAIEKSNQTLLHFFLEVNTETLISRIKRQVIEPENASRDEEIRAWRMAQIDRCVNSKNVMPEGTIFLDAVNLTPDMLASRIMSEIATCS